MMQSNKGQATVFKGFGGGRDLRTRGGHANLSSHNSII